VDLSASGPQNTGGAGVDTLSNFQNVTGSAFNDTITGTAGDNVMDGGLGVDTLSYANAGAGVTVSLALTTAQATGGAGTDTIKNFENLTGSSYNDVLTGTSSANTIVGGAGDDHITGGGKGDILWGGSGADTFIYLATTDSTGSGAGQDQIMDFSHAEGDKIDLSAIDANTNTPGVDDAFTLVAAFTHQAGQLIQVSKSGGFLVEGDVNGDGKADFAVFVHATSPLTTADFVL
jgi:Ca2+-binding RTX toxin-like protein